MNFHVDQMVSVSGNGLQQERCKVMIVPAAGPRFEAKHIAVEIERKAAKGFHATYWVEAKNCTPIEKE